MQLEMIEAGKRVRVSHLEDTTGFIIADRHIDCRKAGMTGTIRSYVPGHGGDVWFVDHDASDDIGAYCFTELEAL